MTVPRKTPFRGGHIAGALAPAAVAPKLFSGSYTLLADISEWEPDLADALYLQWSQAIVIRAAYGDQHDDQAWYGGARRDTLHQLGARFIGIYQYLVAGQDGAAQADAMHRLVGALRPGEVLIADFEEGQHAMLTAWYDRMILLYGTGIRPFLWTYSGLFFAEAQGAAPVEWVAAYGQAEPAVPHKLWQFTSSFPVPGVGSADASIFHGTIDQLAALAYQKPQPQPAPGPAVLGAPRNLTVQAGDTTVRVTRCDPPAGSIGSPDHYLVSVFTGSFPSPATLVATYPRYMKAAPAQFGHLQGIPSGTHMTLRAASCDADGTAGAYADAHFAMP
ncbi:MAG TPA: hypothetical protein VK817_00705 [Trebonia sp.]|jgi:hypothetical protein|nr:hypothetical protein [Trebonia sp.]